MKMKILCVTILSLVYASISMAGNRLAIIELAGDNRALATMLTEDLHTAAKEASETNGVEVVSITKMREILGKRGLSEGCNRPACIEDVTKVVNADLVLVGTVEANSFGFSLTMRVKTWPDLKVIKGDKVEHSSKMGLIRSVRGKSEMLFNSIGSQKNKAEPKLSGFAKPVRSGKIAIAESRAEEVKASDDCRKQTTMKVHIRTKSSRQKMADIYVDGHFKGNGVGPFPVSICAKLVEAETRYGIYSSKLKGLLLPGIESTVTLKRFQKGKRSSRFSRININTANRNRLKGLPGIGDAEAKAILSARKKMGRFNHCRDLVSAIGISLENFERIAPACIAK